LIRGIFSLIAPVFGDPVAYGIDRFQTQDLSIVEYKVSFRVELIL